MRFSLRAFASRRASRAETRNMQSCALLCEVRRSRQDARQGARRRRRRRRLANASERALIKFACVFAQRARKLTNAA